MAITNLSRQGYAYIGDNEGYETYGEDRVPERPRPESLYGTISPAAKTDKI